MTPRALTRIVLRVNESDRRDHYPVVPLVIAEQIGARVAAMNFLNSHIGEAQTGQMIRRELDVWYSTQRRAA